MPGSAIVGAAAIDRHYADLVWADADARADWETGLLDVPPGVARALTEKAERATGTDPLRWGARLFGGRRDG